MKKWLLVIIPIIFLIAITVYLNKPVNIKTETDNVSSVSPTPLLKNIISPQIKYGDNTYNYAILQIKSQDKLQLISNLENKISSQEMIKKGCQKLISATFYDKSDQYLGLFKSGETIYQPETENILLNGFLNINQNNLAKISRNSDYTFGSINLQSGPIIIENGMPLKLEIINDEPARRIIAGVDQQNNLYFIALFNNEDYYLGPKLSDLPFIVDQISLKNKLDLYMVLNLDGGGASVFHSESVDLPELTMVGGFFCINN